MKIGGRSGGQWKFWDGSTLETKKADVLIYSLLALRSYIPLGL
jgi:hypothetical protein